MMIMKMSVVQAGNNGVHWAVLVAGSNTYGNYRHQADICHAYHIVSKNGIPDERIIVMMYDDIAYNSENPYPGNIINQPEGSNVYPGVPKDYSKHEVRPDVFLKVLTGDDDGVEAIIGRKGKVLKSGPNDRVFINFVDHGAGGVLGFPSDLLYKDDLEQAILKMNEKNMYKQMLFYVEACESGSMFANFSEKMADIKVYVTTAANSIESSFACYFDEKRQTYLGDVYSVNWMQDSDKENLEEETLAQQFKLVKSETNTSHVMEYGDLKISKKPVGDFQGSLNSKSLYFSPSSPIPHPLLDAVPSENVDEEVLLRKMAGAQGLEREKHRASLRTLRQRKSDAEQVFRTVVAEVTDASVFEEPVNSPTYLSHYSCYKDSVKLLMRVCPGMNLPQNYYALRKLRVLANLCDAGVLAKDIREAINQAALNAAICA